MLFTFPSRYWFTIGLSGVFSLAGWSPRVRTGFHVSRPTQDTANIYKTYVYGIVTLCDATFQMLLLRFTYIRRSPTTPLMPRHQRFGLFRFRSPLLTKSLLFSFPPGTKMFQFSGFTPFGARSSAVRVAPFGNLRITGYLLLPAAYRSLSRPSSSLRAKASSIRPCLLSSVTFVCFTLLPIFDCRLIIVDYQSVSILVFLV